MARKKKQIEVIEEVVEQVEIIEETNEEPEVIIEAIMTHEIPLSVADMFK